MSRIFRPSHSRPSGSACMQVINILSHFSHTREYFRSIRSENESNHEQTRRVKTRYIITYRKQNEYRG